MSADRQGPWECFHCGELFTTRLTAQDHFGLDECELPGCVAVLTETEKAILEDRRQWRDRAMAAEADNETLGHQLNAVSWDLQRFGNDVQTVTAAWHKFESEQGMRLSAEEKVRWLVGRLRLYDVPWRPLPHDDRTEAEILAEGDKK